MSEEGQKPEKIELQTKDPREATRIALSEVLPKVACMERAAVQEAYRSLARSWDSKGLTSGSAEHVGQVLLRNLTGYGGRQDFDHFTVKTEWDYVDGYWCTQINTLLKDPHRFRPIRLWRTKDEVLACGDEFFEPGPITHDAPTPCADTTPSTRPDPRLRFQCPGCGRSLRSKVELTGKRARCPACRQVFIVGAKSTPNAPESGEQQLNDPTLSRLVSESRVVAAILGAVKSGKLESLSKALSPLGNLWDEGILQGVAFADDHVVATYRLGERLSELDPNLSVGWYLMAYALKDHSYPHPLDSVLGFTDVMERVSARVQALRKAVASDPNFAYPLVSLANELNQYGVTPENIPLMLEAVECLNRAIEVLPNASRYRDNVINRWRRLITRVNHCTDGRVIVDV